MPIYDVYQSMETGLVDCTVTFSYFAVATKLHELLKTIAPMGLASQTVVLTCMNKDTFDGMSAEEQDAVMTAAGQMSDYYGEKLAGADAEATGLDGQATLDEFIGLVGRWNQVAETQGFPWENN